MHYALWYSRQVGVRQNLTLSAEVVIKRSFSTTNIVLLNGLQFSAREEGKGFDDLHACAKST